MTCSKNKYCSFTSKADSKDHKAEQCIYCGKKAIYRVINGRVNNIKYLRDHVRDFCQPYGRTSKVYMEVYGKETLKRNQQLHRDRAKAKANQAGIKDYAIEELTKAYRDDKIFV